MSIYSWGTPLFVTYMGNGYAGNSYTSYNLTMVGDFVIHGWASKDSTATFYHPNIEYMYSLSHSYNGGYVGLACGFSTVNGTISAGVTQTQDKHCTYIMAVYRNSTDNNRYRIKSSSVVNWSDYSNGGFGLPLWTPGAGTDLTIAFSGWFELGTTGVGALHMGEYTYEIGAVYGTNQTGCSLYSKPMSPEYTSIGSCSTYTCRGGQWSCSKALNMKFNYANTRRQD